MFKKIILTSFILLLLMSCTSNQSVRGAFKHTIEKDNTVQKYTILSEDKNAKTGTIFYQSVGEVTTISLRVFKKYDGEWKLINTGSCDDRWNITSEEGKKNIYCGTLTDQKYVNVFIDNEKAKVIKIKNGNTKAWYYLSTNPNASIVAEQSDGKKEIWHQSK